MFPKRYYTYAMRIAKSAHELWVHDRLTERRIRRLLRDIIGDVPLHSGSYRTTAILPNGVIKVPHDTAALRSTFLEMELFTRAYKSSTLARHFPQSVAITNGAVPVLIQEEIDSIARPTDEHVTHLVQGFAKHLGIGDVHAHNYGWRSSTKGLCPVFVDCETSTRFTALTPRDIDKLDQVVHRWTHTLHDEDVFV